MQLVEIIQGFVENIFLNTDSRISFVAENLFNLNNSKHEVNNQI